MYLVDKYHQRLYSYCQVLGNDHSTSEDIVQNVFIRTWHFRKKLKPEFSLQAFLYKTAYNEFLMEYRRNKKVIPLEHDHYGALNEVVGAMDEETLEKMISQVTVEIQNLPKKCREIFTLSKREGLTNMEISDYLNISIKTVETHITHAFSILRQKLGDQYESFLFLLLSPNLTPK
ncbi:RNA polymerase sigma factor [Sinomicrobium weinanense]|nr:sigma-70 family RNA polymerase sigma factor [Sinomicrobium weinanense]